MSVLLMQEQLHACRLEEHEKDRLHVVNENEILKQKLKALLDQFEARDNHFNQQVLAHEAVCSYSYILLECFDSLVMLQLQTKELELQMAGMKLQEQSELVDRAEVQSKKMSEAFQQMQNHKLETDKLLASYNERFSECQQSIEKSNEVSLHSLTCVRSLLVLSDAILTAMPVASVRGNAGLSVNVVGMLHAHLITWGAAPTSDHCSRRACSLLPAGIQDASPGWSAQGCVVEAG